MDHNTMEMLWDLWAIIMDRKGKEHQWGRFLNKSYVTKIGTIWANQEWASYIAKEEQTQIKAAKHDCANFSN